MQPISDFDDRFQVIRSLIRRKELPVDWYTDDAYSIAFTTNNQVVTKMTVTISSASSTVIREYEPVTKKQGDKSPHSFMLKTSEVLQTEADPL